MKVFIGGSRSVDEFDENIEMALFDEFNSGATILVGDADGVDCEVQRFCAKNHYGNILVYASNGKVRNNVGGFEVRSVPVARGTDRRDFFVAKDIAMIEDADYGIIIWDGKSRGSLGQIKRLIRQNKPCYIYYVGEKRWLTTSESRTIDENSLLNMPKQVQLSFI